MGNQKNQHPQTLDEVLAAFDELVEKPPKHLPTPPAIVAELVADLEARLDHLAHPRESGRMPDGFHVEAAALRLAHYYRRTGDKPSMKRFILAYGEAFRVAAERASPMLAIAWLERCSTRIGALVFARRLRQLRFGAASWALRR
jgi:hypothetical protein